MNRSDAAKGAAAALKSIEQTGRITACAAIVSAICSALVAAVVLFMLADYLAAKRTAQQAVEGFRQSLARTAPAPPGRPALTRPKNRPTD